jgi:hypothetical protein
LGVALIISILINVISLVLKIKLSLLSGAVFGTLLLDALILAVCIGIFLGIIQYEVGDYLPDDKQTSIKGTAVLGVRFWILIALFGARLISHPFLLIGFIAIALLVPVMVIFVIFLVLSLFGCVSTKTTINHVVKIKDSRLWRPGMYSDSWVR